MLTCPSPLPNTPQRVNIATVHALLVIVGAKTSILGPNAHQIVLVQHFIPIHKDEGPDLDNKRKKKPQFVVFGFDGFPVLF